MTISCVLDTFETKVHDIHDRFRKTHPYSVRSLEKILLTHVMETL